MKVNTVVKWLMAENVVVNGIDPATDWWLYSTIHLNHGYVIHVDDNTGILTLYRQSGKDLDRFSGSENYAQHKKLIKRAAELVQMTENNIVRILKKEMA